MKLVDHNDLVKAANLNKIGGEGAARVLMMVLRVNRINRIYSKISKKNTIEFIDALFKELGIKFEINEDGIKKIPKEGPFITISNHPYGGIDGILLIKLFSPIRPDYKIGANSLLQRI